MKLTLSHRPGFRSAVCLLGALICAAAAGPPAVAQTQATRPDGMAVGRWFLSPYFFQGFQYDDNVFRRPGEPQSDRISRTTVGIEASLPVSNSFFDLGYMADRFDYAENQFSRDWAQEASAGWRINFGSGDRLVLSERYYRGITDMAAIDEGGELVFQGQGYNLNRWNVELSRSIRKRPGYLVRITRADLNWVAPEDEDRQVPFFDYRGYDTRFEYRHPVPPGNWVIVHSHVRRFDHYRARGYSDPETGLPDSEVGVPFRSEESESVLVGLLGTLGRDQPFFARVGWGRFAYTGLEASQKEFRGLVGQAQWSLRVGSRTRVELNANRRPLPSSFPTYYIVNELRVRADREWLRYSRAGVELLYSRNRYGEPLPLTGCGDQIRRDTRWLVEAFMDWLVSSKFGFRMAAAHYERGSNCAAADYSANSLTAGITLGWF